MGKRLSVIVFCVSLLLAIVSFPVQGLCDVSMKEINTIQLEKTPVDVSISQESGKLYVLAKGMLYIYSLQTGKLDGALEVDSELNKIAGAIGENIILLSSASKKTVQIALVNMYRKIDIEGSPVRGDVKAPVTLVVFGDFQ